MEASGRSRSTTSLRSSHGKVGAENTLAAPYGRSTSKSSLRSSINSVASSDTRDDDMKSTGAGSLDRSKSRTSDDGHSEASSHRRRMSKLFKGRKKRRKSMPDELLQGDADEIPPLPVQRPQSAVSPFQTQSEESLGLHKSVASSLLTEDSEEATESSPARPGISPHHSHAGLLTLSSPLITSETIDSTAPSEPFLTDSNTSAETTHTPKRSITTDVAANVKRGPSPLGKLKEAFSPQRRATSPKPIIDHEEPGATVDGLGLSLSGGDSRQGSNILENAGPLHASPPQLHESGQTRSSPSIPKRIITQLPATPPNLHETPTTLVTPPTPTDAKAKSPTESTSSSRIGAKHTPSQSNPNVVVSPSGNMISHRRARSATNPPSKLSNSISAPLTPTIEEVKTPGGTAALPAQSTQSPSGFFSSVFSAAQNAANSLSKTIADSAIQNKNKPASQHTNTEERPSTPGGEEVIGPESTNSSTVNIGTEKRRLAVETLGSGNLSLAELGISESSDPSPMTSTVNLNAKGDEASAKAEDIAAAQAVSAAYAAEKSADRPRSLTSTSAPAGGATGAVSPQRQPEITDSPAPSSIQRQGSIRSRISGGRRRRHRGSSATTGNNIAAAIVGSTTNLTATPTSGQRLNGTGFAVAPSKRNRDFHNLFKSVPEDDYLIEDYSAALQKEILLHGRLYVSEGHLCFSSNILGWVTNLVISFDEVVSVEKKSTAVLFPNAIVIQTLHARNIFASFLTRDSTYDLIIGIWKISHPNLKSSLNGVALDGSGTGDRTEKAESIGSDEGSTQDSDDEVYDEDAEDDDGMGSFTDAADGSVVSEAGSVKVGETRKASATIAQAVSGGASKLSEGAEVAVNNATGAQDFPGPSTHAPTDCGDADSHYDKLLIDTTIPAPLGKIYSLMFGPASGVFMRKWLLEDQKSTELQMEDDKKGLGSENKTFKFSYIKPLPGSIGPRQTKCNIDMSLEQFDLEKGVTVLCSTGTPDVPSGSIFLTKTRYCLSWGPNNSTRLLMTFTVEWSGKSWLRGPIEKGANEGQLTYATALASALRAAVSAKAPAKVPGKGGKSRKRRAQVADEASPEPISKTAEPKAKDKNWGVLEPVRGLLGPLADIVESLFEPKIIIAILVLLLTWNWLFSAPSRSHTSPGHHTPAQRIAAYEEIWRTEESELWKWLEERVTLDRVHSAAGNRLREENEMQHRLVIESAEMKERVIDEAIRTTEEKLGALKQAVRRERETNTKSPKEEQT